MSNTATPNKAAKAPTHNAYQVRKGKSKNYWTKIGATWAHEDGKGFSLQIDSVPLDGKIAVRVVAEKRDAE